MASSLKPLPNDDLTDLTPHADRFWAKVDKRGLNECWPWAARAKTDWGYGVFRVSPLYGNEGAHRMAFMLTSGESVEKGVFVLHSCDNPACCNPAHLRLGTPLDNMRDMYERGRGRHIGLKGEANGRAKLTADDVRAIRASPLSPPRLAEQYGLTRSYAYKLKMGLMWEDAA